MGPGSRLARLLLLSQGSAHSSYLLRGLQSRVYGAKDAIGLLHSKLHSLGTISDSAVIGCCKIVLCRYAVGSQDAVSYTDN